MSRIHCTAYNAPYLYVFMTNASNPGFQMQTTDLTQQPTPVFGDPVSIDKNFIVGDACSFYDPYLYIVGEARHNNNDIRTYLRVINMQEANETRVPDPLISLSLPDSYDSYASVAPVVGGCVALTSSDPEDLVSIMCSGGGGEQNTTIDGFQNAQSNLSVASTANGSRLAVLSNSAFAEFSVSTITESESISVNRQSNYTSSYVLPVGTILPISLTGSSVLSSTFQALVLTPERTLYFLNASSSPPPPLDKRQEEALSVPGEISSKVGYANNAGILNITAISMPSSFQSTSSVSIVISSPDQQVYFVGSGADGGLFQEHQLLSSLLLPWGTNSTSGGDNNGTSSDHNSVSAAHEREMGVIAGSVVGGIIALAIIAAIFVWHIRRGRSRSANSFDPLTEEKNLSSAVSFAPTIEKQRTPIGSLIRQMHLSRTELENIDPASSAPSGTPILGGAYTLTQEPAVFMDHPQQYATRTIQDESLDEHQQQLYTLHYYVEEEQVAFLANVNATCAIASLRVVQHHDAIALVDPPSTTPYCYRYLWISSPCPPHQSLDYILNASSSKSITVVDVSDYAFKAWSTFALLQALQDVHAAGWTHLSLSPHSFYYPDLDHVSDWQLTGFHQAHRQGERVLNDVFLLNLWSAPELFTNNDSRSFRQIAQPTHDIWSLGCIIYQLATGGHTLISDIALLRHRQRKNRDQFLQARMLDACSEASMVHASYGPLLEGMLQLDPKRRTSAADLAAYWKNANGLYDDEDSAGEVSTAAL